MVGLRGESLAFARRFLGAVVGRSRFGVALVLAGCGGMTFVVQQYAGPQRSAERVAIIRVGAGGPEVVSVDDVPLRVTLEPQNRVHVEVLPGPHEVDVEVTEPEIGLRHVLPVRFLAQAGKVYRVEVLAVATAAGTGSEARWDARAYEVDRDSDVRLSVAAAVPAATPPVSPPPPAPAPSPPAADAVPGADASVTDSGPSPG
jgi:hypothetical protein